MSRPPGGRAGGGDGEGGEPDPGMLAPLSELARGHVAASPAARPGLAAWAAFRVARSRDQRRRRLRALVLGAGLAAASAVGVRGLLVTSFGGGLTYAIEGATVAGGYVSNVRGTRARLTFSDGTLVALEHGSRAWVASTGAEGARIRLEDGRARFSVRHRANARWSVEAGPYTVLVTGTEFEVRWSATNDVFRLRLQDGSVTVQGPFTGGGVRLGPGQELEARPGEGALRIGHAAAREAPGPVAASAALPAPVAEAVAPATVPDAGAGAGAAKPLEPPPSPARARAHALVVGMASPSRAGTRPELDPPPPQERPPAQDLGAGWAREVARGQFESVLREAAELGPDRGVGTLGSDRLAALADAARYAGHPDLARRALLAQRARFAGLAAAREAAFLLGRLAEDATGARKEALNWYERYLVEAPSGSFAAEALGRRLVILSDMLDAYAASAAASEYLERFPDGAYARRARQIEEAMR